MKPQKPVRPEINTENPMPLVAVLLGLLAWRQNNIDELEQDRLNQALRRMRENQHKRPRVLDKPCLPFYNNLVN